jgi:hypothetical protein
MERTYRIAGHVFRVSGENLCKAVESMAGFKPFVYEGGISAFTFQEADIAEVPSFLSSQYTFETEGVGGNFGRTSDGFRMSMKAETGETFEMWCHEGDHVVFLGGHWMLRMYRFALWVAYGLMTLKENTLAIHSSCIVYQGKAVMFLGESGTGKSTHTRLWREHIDGSFLLNDDSPMVRVEDGKTWVYGSAWSGKTPCYRNERYELKACVRLSQAPHNRIRKLPLLQAYASLHPSCAPEFAYDDALYDEVSRTLGQILSEVPVYHLECLPDGDAARLSCQTVFS